MRQLVILTCFFALNAYAAKVDVRAMPKSALKPKVLGPFQVVQADETTTRSYFADDIFADIAKVAEAIQPQLPEHETGDPVFMLVPGFTYVPVSGEHPHYFNEDSTWTDIEIPKEDLKNAAAIPEIGKFVVEQIKAVRIYKEAFSRLRTHQVDINLQIPVTMANPYLDKIQETINSLKWKERLEVVLTEADGTHHAPSFDKDQPSSPPTWVIFADIDPENPDAAMDLMVREIKGIAGCANLYE